MNKKSNKLIVISGCSSGGKSTLLSELENHGYSIIPEAGRILVKEQLEIKSEITPWQNPKLFCEKLIERSVIAYNHAKEIPSAKGQVIFFDRCILEGIIYYQNLKIENSTKYDNLVHKLRYDPIILMTPPWKEIYCQDEERKHSYEEAVEEYEQLLKSYPKYGYQILEIPKMSIKKRFQFVTSIINSHKL
jgi:predicted ATPase